MPPVDDFQPGFYGMAGTGAGYHLPSASDSLDAQWSNKIEYAIIGLHTYMQGNGMSGSFQLEATGESVSEYFSGDGTTQTFYLKRYINKFLVVGYDNFLADPYSVSILPTGLGGELIDFDEDTSLSNTLYFSRIPESGNKNIKISYYTLLNYPSQLGGGCYLDEWQVNI